MHDWSPEIVDFVEVGVVDCVVLSPSPVHAPSMQTSVSSNASQRSQGRIAKQIAPSLSAIAQRRGMPDASGGIGITSRDGQAR